MFEGAQPRFSWRKLWMVTGPGWLMSRAYLDPGNLESDLQAGAIAGYDLIWVLFWATFFGFLLQVLAAKLGVVAGQQLASTCREQYGPRLRTGMWLLTEVAIIGSDVQEVVGSAIALNLLFGWPIWVGVLVTALDTFTFLLLHYFGMRRLEAFFVSLVFVMFICFLVTAIVAKPSVGSMIEGLIVPRVPRNAVVQAVGMLGAVIMPHNIYLHSALVQTRKIDRTKSVEVTEAIKYNIIESAMTLGVSFFINLTIVAVFAKGFYKNPDYPDSDGIGLHKAGQALESAFGESAKWLWGIGLLAAGQASTMTGTLAGQYVMNGFLQIQITPWLRVLLTRSVAIVPSIIVGVLFTESMDVLDEWLNVLQSLMLPFALIPVLKFTSSVNVMGEYRSHPVMKVVCWTLAVVVVGINGYLVSVFADKHLPHRAYVWVVLAFIAIAYLAIVGVIAWRPVTFVPSALKAHHRHYGAVSGTDTGDDALVSVSDLGEGRL